MGIAESLKTTNIFFIAHIRTTELQKQFRTLLGKCSAFPVASQSKLFLGKLLPLHQHHHRLRLATTFIIPYSVFDIMEDGNENETEEIGLELMSKALILFGGIILSTHIILNVFSADALQQGTREDVWFLPRSQFSIVPVISILMIVFGIILYFLHLQLRKLEKIAEEVEEG